jgi:hypothetical protein
MMMRAVALCSAAFYLLVATTARAATVTAIQGDVLVNHGSGYERVVGQMEVMPGDTVVVGTAGAAEITYGLGCIVPVPIGAVVAVKAEPPCGPLTTGAVDDPAPNLLTPTTVTLGVVALGGAALAAVALTKKKDKAASP